MTELPQDLFEEFLQEVNPSFLPEKYNLIHNNCNNFTDTCAQFLVGQGIPRYIVDLPKEALSTPMGKNLLGMLGGMEDNIMKQSQNQSLFDPRQMEGNHNPQQLSFGQQSQPHVPAGPQPVVEILNQQQYVAEIGKNTACVIDVFTEWCGPCKAIKPFFANLPNSYPQIRFFKMDLDKNKFLGTSLGIQSIPTFLFIHKGQVVKKMAGADQNGLLTNIKWLISSYNLAAPQPAKVEVVPQVKQTIRLYSETPESFYFDNLKWELPIKKIKEFGKSKGLFTGPYANLDDKLLANYLELTAEVQNLGVDFALKYLPIDDPDNLVPFVDFFRHCLLNAELSKYS